MRGLFLLLLVVAASVFSFGARAAGNTTYTYQSQALTACQAYAVIWNNSYGQPGYQMSCVLGGAPAGTLGAYYPSISGIGGWWAWTTAGNDCASLQNQVIPAGTSVDDFGQGTVCKSSCSVALVLNASSSGPPSGSYAYSGGACPVSSGSTSKPLPSSSETYNPDGSKTYCDPLSGKCVTAQFGSDAPPASSSSTGNHSTDSSSVTDNPATTSSTTTNTTTTGDGTGGTGTGSGSSTSVSQSKTDNPASSSSTSSKCTTGVCDVGEADGNLGQLYTPSADTPSSVYASFEAQVSQSPVIGAATSFFSFTPSGSCPAWHIPGNKYWGEAGFDFSFFCDPAFAAILKLAGFLVLAVAAFGAFRIALY